MIGGGVICYIGIDLGTSAAKLILTDGDAKILKTISKSYPLDFTADGKSEQDPRDWLDAVVSGVRELTAQIAQGDLRGIGVGGQMHGLVMLDENDEVLRPAILWNDTRPEPQTAYLNGVVGRETLQALTGNIAFAGFTAPKILWVKEHEPEIFARCRKICLPKDYINYMLTGVFSTDVSDASGTLFFDVEHRRWSAEMLEILGISEDMLPAVYESAAPVGTVKPEYGFGDGVTVCAGAGDNAAAAIGTDTVRDGQCNISLGTSGTVFLPTDEYVKTANPALHSFCHANGKYHLMGCILSAASANKWLVEEVFDTKDYDKNERPLTPETAARKVFFAPYLAGERCPHNDGGVRGAFVGLSLDTKRSDLQNAVLEGVSFALKDCLVLAGRDLKTATVCGGGTKSRLWMEILANVLNLELSVIENEGPALGAAVLSIAACGGSVEIGNDVKYTVLPDPELAGIYAEKYEIYKKIYPAINKF